VGPFSYTQPNPTHHNSHGPNPTVKSKPIAILKCHYCSVTNIKCEEQKCLITKNNIIYLSKVMLANPIEPVQCSQPSQQKSDNTNQLYYKSRRCHFLMHWYESLNYSICIQIEYSIDMHWVRCPSSLIQRNPSEISKSRPSPTQPNPTHGWTRPMTNSGSESLQGLVLKSNFVTLIMQYHIT